MNDRLSALKLFARVAQTGSFSAAGKELGLSQPSASRMVASLEADIGVALFTRTTRAVVLTEAGARYLSRIESILLELIEADHEARGTDELRGTLRVGMSSTLGIREFIPLLPHFMRSHPNLQIELLMDDQREDLVTKGVDVAMRLGPLTDSTATARLILTSPSVLTASPGYLAEMGLPTAPSDLVGHSMITGPTGRLGRQSFRRDADTEAHELSGHLRVSTVEGALAAALAGLGIASSTLLGCRREIECGTLIRVLPDWDTGQVALHAVFAGGRASKPSARAFADFLFVELNAR